MTQLDATGNSLAVAGRPEVASGEELSLLHRSVVEPLLRDLGSPLSEYSFANLFLFRRVHGYRLIRHPLPHVLGTTYDGVTHAMPLVELEAGAVRVLLGRARCIYPLTEDMARRALGHGMSLEWNDDDSDYTFDAARLAELEGKVLRPKRAQAQAFAATVNPSVAPLGPGNLSSAVEVLELWAGQVNRSSDETDYAACREALENFDALGLNGLVINDARGAACGFLLAQRIGKGGVAVHFAKGNREYAGIYPFMFSQFAARAGASWLNFEQDLGKAGLRRAKRALDPSGQMRKFRLTGAPR